MTKKENIRTTRLESGIQETVVGAGHYYINTPAMTPIIST